MVLNTAPAAATPDSRSQTEAAHAAVQRGEPLVLDLFIPYRLSVLSNIISRSVARIYGERFDLTIPEWRIMAVLGQAEQRGQEMSANAVSERTEMDKVQVSRAVSRMISAGILDRTMDRDDRRRSILHLSDKGRAVYQEIVPAALRYEDELLETLSTDDLITLERLISKLTKSARALDATGGEEG